MQLFLDDATRSPHQNHGTLVLPARGWYLAGASRRGRSHEKQDIERQDAFALAMSGPFDARRWYAMAVADGVGSASHAREGARLCATTVVRALCRHLDATTECDVRDALKGALYEARVALEQTSHQLRTPLRQLATTLLVALAVERADQLELAAFQAGDGLVGAFRAEKSRLLTLLDPQDNNEEGAVRPFHDASVLDSLDDKRLQSWKSDELDGLILMTDGVATDLIPLKQGGPVLIRGLAAIEPGASAGQELLELISYQKRGSLDDRTLVGLFRVPRPAPVDPTRDSAAEKSPIDDRAEAAAAAARPAGRSEAHGIDEGLAPETASVDPDPGLLRARRPDSGPGAMAGGVEGPGEEIGR